MHPLRLPVLTCLALAGPGVAQEGPVPDCADLPADAAGMADCALIVDPLLLAFLYEPVPDGAILRITQATAEGGARETSGDIPVKGVDQPPGLLDIDDDGVAELFIPISRSEDGTVFQLWRLAEPGFFAQLDTVTAQTLQSFELRGDLIFRVEPGPDGVTNETAFVFDDAGLAQIYAVTMDRAAGTCAMLGETSIWNEAIILADCEARLGETDLEEQ